MCRDRRTSALAKIHLAKRDLGLDDAAYRGLLQRVTGKRSAGALTERQLGAVLDELKRLGFKPVRPMPKAATFADRVLEETHTAMQREASEDARLGKIRALWKSLHALGEIDDPSDRAIAAYARRTTGIEALPWLDGEASDKVIRSLRKWCERVGFVQPDAPSVRELNGYRARANLGPADTGLTAKIKLVELLWQRLEDAGALQYGPFNSLSKWLHKHAGASAPYFLTAAQADRTIEQLGAWLRRARGKAPA